MKRLFVCEKCGTRVKRDAVACDYCGQVFNGIKCPRCGFSGESGLFGQGCPACGFTGSFDSRDSDAHAATKRPKYAYTTPKKTGKMLSLTFYRILGGAALLLIIALVVIIIRYYM